MSRIQVELLVRLIGTRATLNAVGDDSQCIYAWRGSRPELLGEDSDRFFPDATRYTLSKTFRFGYRVSLAAGMLKWPMVIVAGLEEGQFPSERSDPEEEQRLAYVAFTRAKERLVIAIPPDERFDAAWEGRESRGPAISRTPASRFVFEARLRTAVSVGDAVSKRLSGADPQIKLPDVPADASALLNRYLEAVAIPDRYAVPKAQPGASRGEGSPRWAVNDRIRHQVFGEGRIVRVSEKDVLDIDFAGKRRSIKLGIVALERIG